jgi:hypothetical protein
LRPKNVAGTDCRSAFQETKKCRRNQGCQISLGKTYQNGEKYTKKL